MTQGDQLVRTLEDIHSQSPEAVVAAAKELLERGDYGTPAGTYPLEGGKAALRLGRLADAVVLLHHGLKVAEPDTQVWADLLVNRAIACAHHGFYRDAITAGEQFLHSADSLPAKTAVYIPYAHHAAGFAYDELKEHHKAAAHLRLAVDLHTDPVERARASSDLALLLARLGKTDEADMVLQGAQVTQDTVAQFALAGAEAMVRYHQGRFTESVATAERAQALVLGNEDQWAAPLAELNYWLSRAVYQLGDRYRAGALALRAAITADQHWRLDLRDRASDWLAEIMDKGGIHRA